MNSATVGVFISWKGASTKNQGFLPSGNQLINIYHHTTDIKELPEYVLQEKSRRRNSYEHKTIMIINNCGKGRNQKLIHQECYGNTPKIFMA